MINYDVVGGTTDFSVVIRIIDSTDGTPETGVVYNTSGIALEYRREGATSTAITEATLAALTTAHADGGFLHIGNGYYRLDLPDAAVAAGASGCLVHGVVTGMVVIGCYIHIHDVSVARYGVNMVQISADATAADNLEAMFDGTGYAGGTAKLKVDLDTIKTQPVTCAAGVTVLASVGTAGTSTAQTGDAYARLGAPAGASVSADIAAIEAQTDDIGAAGAGLTAVPWNAAWDAEVQSEVVDALNIDTYVEPGQGTPPATATLVQKIGYLYKSWRNKKTQTASEWALYADDGSTKDQESAVTDDGTTTTKAEIQTGA
jgi:hypothetical protein